MSSPTVTPDMAQSSVSLSYCAQQTAEAVSASVTFVAQLSNTVAQAIFSGISQLASALGSFAKCAYSFTGTALSNVTNTVCDVASRAVTVAKPVIGATSAFVAANSGMILFGVVCAGLGAGAYAALTLPQDDAPTSAPVVVAPADAAAV